MTCTARRTPFLAVSLNPHPAPGPFRSRPFALPIQTRTMTTIAPETIVCGVNCAYVASLSLSLARLARSATLQLRPSAFDLQRSRQLQLQATRRMLL